MEDGIKRKYALEIFRNGYCACFSPNPERIEDILRLAKSQNANGVIYATLPFCQTYQLEFPGVQKALREAGIHLLSIESDFSDEDAGQLSTRIHLQMPASAKLPHRLKE